MQLLASSCRLAVGLSGVKNYLQGKCNFEFRMTVTQKKTFFFVISVRNKAAIPRNKNALKSFNCLDGDFL